MFGIEEHFLAQFFYRPYLYSPIMFASLQVSWLSKEWAKRAALPSHVVTMLDNFPTNLHPMSQFSAAITALNSESSFARAYSEGVNKAKYWEVSHTQTDLSMYSSQTWVQMVFDILKILSVFD